MKQHSIALLALLLCASSLASCGDTEAAVTNQTEATSTVTETAAPDEPTNEDIVRAQIGAQDFGGYTFRVASRNSGGDFYRNTGSDVNELFYEKETGDTMNDAIYHRNRKTEELLNIKIEPVWISDSPSEVVTVSEQNILAGDNFADAIIHRLDYGMNTAAKGMLYNFIDIPTMHLDNPWWDQTITANFTMFGDQLYTLCGDIVFFDDYAVQAIFGNTRLMAENDIEIPYQDVRDVPRTFDKFIETAKLGSVDLNGDGKIEREVDQIGYGNHEGAVLHMIYCFDERMSMTQEDGTIVVNYGGEQIINAVTKISDFLNSCTDAIGDSCPDIFNEGRMMFFMEMIGGIGGMRDMQDDYCVLPMPKGDESMDSYRAYVSNGWTTCYTVPTTAEDVERIGTILEAMSAISADTVTPALYDIMLEQKYVRDAESQEMLSYIWASKAYDLAGDLDWASSLRDVYYNIAQTGKNNFVSRMEKSLKNINKRLDTFLAAFSE